MTIARDMLAAETIAPTVIFIGYGVVKFVTMGTASTNWLDTYWAVGGGLASWVAVFAYDVAMSTPRRRRSLLRMISMYGGFIPLLYSLYAVGYLGVYTIYYSIFLSFSMRGLIFGVICIYFGYRMAYGLQAITESRRPPSGTRPD